MLDTNHYGCHCIVTGHIHMNCNVPHHVKACGHVFVNHINNRSAKIPEIVFPLLYKGARWVKGDNRTLNSCLANHNEWITERGGNISKLKAYASCMDVIWSETGAGYTKKVIQAKLIYKPNNLLSDLV